MEIIDFLLRFAFFFAAVSVAVMVVVLLGSLISLLPMWAQVGILLGLSSAVAAFWAAGH